jgi:hypothetical protein
MKKIKILLVLFFPTVLAFGQKTVSEINKPVIDINGFARYSSQENVFNEKNYQINSSNGDSIRTLSEINNPLNADCFPWISGDGLRLYFVSGSDTNKLMFCSRNNTNSYFNTPTSIPGLNHPQQTACSYWLSSNELDLYILGGSAMTFSYSSRITTSSPFSTPISISLLGSNINLLQGPSLDITQNELFLYQCLVGTKVYTRTSATSFTYKMTLPFPSGYYSGIKAGQLSRDGLTYMFSGANNNGGGKDQLFKMTRPSLTDSFTIGTFQLVQDINDSLRYNYQPSISNNFDCIVFVRNNYNSWSSSDLYISQKGLVTNVFRPDAEKIKISVFPNPSDKLINFKFDTYIPTHIKLFIYNYQGKLIDETIHSLSSNNNISFNSELISNGIYFYKLVSEFDSKEILGHGKVVVNH